MFTGIIEKKSKIISREGGRFTLENKFPGELQIGQSIAHDGACMTIESLDDEKYTFFVMQESLSKTNLGEKNRGDFLNIERCMKVDARIDGHFVSGHIDTTGEIIHLEKIHDGSLIIGIEFNPSFSKYTIEKGSIAINGTSLTIVEKKIGYLSVSLIPLTQDWTNLGESTIGDSVNLEFDMLGKYILASRDDS